MTEPDRHATDDTHAGRLCIDHLRPCLSRELCRVPGLQCPLHVRLPYEKSKDTSLIISEE
jgi:hypothetical protein